MTSNINNVNDCFESINDGLKKELTHIGNLKPYFHLMNAVTTMQILSEFNKMKQTQEICFKKFGAADPLSQSSLDYLKNHPEIISNSFKLTEEAGKYINSLGAGYSNTIELLQPVMDFVDHIVNPLVDSNKPAEAH